MFGFPLVELPPIVTSSCEATVRYLVDRLVESGQIEARNADRVACQVLHRESQGSTAIGRGLALPHSKSDVVNEVHGIVGQSSLPVSWPRGVDEEAVRIVCLLVTPAQEPATILRALEAVSRRMKEN